MYLNSINLLKTPKILIYLKLLKNYVFLRLYPAEKIIAGKTKLKKKLWSNCIDVLLKKEKIRPITIAIPDSCKNLNFLLYELLQNVQ